MFKRTLALILVFGLSAQAQTINVAPGDSIQEIIKFANAGDVIQLAAGRYKESIQLNGKAITLRGLGRDTILQTKGFRPIITINENETQDTIIENLTLSNGLRAGAILIDRAAPIIRKCWIYKNKAIGSASGIITFGKNSNGDSAIIANNVFYKNKTRSARAGNISHAISINDSNPLIANNTFLANDRAGIFVKGTSKPIITNNIFAYMGFIKAPERKKIGDLKAKEPRGRAIYIENLRGGANIQVGYNISFNNKAGDVYYQGEDFSFEELDAANPSFTVFGNNLKVDPLFTSMRLNRKGTKVTRFLNAELSSSSPGIDAGNPDSEFNDTDSSRSDIGATGGATPFTSLLEDL